MKLFSLVGRSVALVALAVTSAGAAPILTVTGASVLLTDPTQLGRMTRDGLPSNWFESKTFPGAINLAVPYHYATWAVNVGSTEYIQISTDQYFSNSTFFSAYLTSYNPLGLNVNYLGDAGFSGNTFGFPSFFQVRVPVNQTLVIVVNNTAPANGGVGEVFDFLVEGFIDSEYTDPLPAPEPAAMLLGGMGVWAVIRRRRTAGLRA